MQQLFSNKNKSCHILYCAMEKCEYIEFLKDDNLINKMNEEYKSALISNNNVTNICTIIEYMCNKRISNKKKLIKVMLNKLKAHSLYLKYVDYLEKIEENCNLIAVENFTLEFYIGKDFLKTLHKIDQLQQSIIMELKELECFYKDKMLNEIKQSLVIKDVIIAYFLDNYT